MINTQNLPRRHEEQIPTGKRVKFCRCWQIYHTPPTPTEAGQVLSLLASATFPYCDDAHKKINAETGDVLGPVVVTGVAAVEDQESSE